MPTITVSMKDMGELIGSPMSMDEFEKHLPLAKAELKAHDTATGEARIELSDTNRPDLWSSEGVARQVRCFLEGRVPKYPFQRADKRPKLEIEVDHGLKTIRPCVAAFAARGPAVTEELLAQLIQTQENLCENFGRKRRSIAIGIYNAARIRFPVRYVAARANEYPFVPLGFEKPMTLDRILEEHPKGKEYAHLVRDNELYPLLVDSRGRVLSFPPIINSRRTGEIGVGDNRLFVEATGMDMRQVILAVNIMAANMIDRGWKVRPVLTRLPYDSALGREVPAPLHLDSTVTVDLDSFDAALGDACTREEIKSALAAYGIAAKSKPGRKLAALCPPYRDDYLHPVDVIEDFAVSRGYHTFEPVMPSRMTVGKLHPLSLLTDRVRDQMVGLGFEEIFSNILSDRANERDNMRIPDEPAIAIDNVMSETYSVVRSSILPSLLRVEAASSKSSYPHKLFECGEVSPPDAAALYGCRTEHRLCAFWAADDSGFSEIHSVLDMLLYYMGREYSLRAAELPFYFEGRAGEIVMDSDVCGHIGELHPAVLTNFGITMPCAAFELTLRA
jgi:phenylalanyl-tRNA synthetase beta chain